MLSPEDLADLAAELRAAGLRVGPQQLLSAQTLLLRPEVCPPGTQTVESIAALGRWLGPIFCTRPAEQQVFDGLYARWVRRRLGEPERPRTNARGSGRGGSSPTADGPGAGTLPLPSARRWGVRRGGLWLAGAALAAAVAWSGWAAWQMNRSLVVSATVVRDGLPVDAARVQLAAREAITDAQGRVAFTVRAADLPERLQILQAAASPADAVLATEMVGGEVAQWRGWLWLAAPWAASIAPVTISLPAIVEATDAGEEVFEAGGGGAVDTSGPAAWPRLASFDLAALTPRPGELDRWQWHRLALLCAPFLALAVLVAWRGRPRAVLQRLAARTPPALTELHLPGGLSAIAPGLALARVSQALRQRLRVDTGEVQVDRTIHATLQRGGLLTPVRGARVEPEHLAFVDRTGRNDHQALLAAEVVAELARSDVLVERFDFDGDAAQVRPVDAVPPRPGARPRPLSTVDLGALHERHPGHRVLVFSDGAEAFDGYTGAPSPWLHLLAAWAQVIWLTPRPRDQWGQRELALGRLGFIVLPLDSDGMTLLAATVAEAGLASFDVSTASAAAAEAGRSPGPGGLLADPRYLDRAPPDPAEVTRLVAELEARLGPRGLAWLASLAAYPELHWGITLRLGAAMVPKRADFERLLPSLAALPWLRSAFLPDWLRAALLARLGASDLATVRRILGDLLTAVSQEASRSGERAAAMTIPLRIATSPDGGPAAGLGARLRGLAAAWRRAWSWRQLITSADGASPLRDHVFLRVVSGRRISALDFVAPRTLVARLNAYRLAPRRALVGGMIAAAAYVGVVLLVWPPRHDGQPLTWLSYASWSANGDTVTVVRHDLLTGTETSWGTSVEGLALGGVVQALSRDGSNRWTATAAERERGVRIRPARSGDVRLVDDGSRLWVERRGPDGRMARVVPADPLTGERALTVLSSDGAALASLTRQGQIGVWSAVDGRRLALHEAGDLLAGLAPSDGWPARDLAIAPDGSVALVAGGLGTGSPVRLWPAPMADGRVAARDVRIARVGFDAAFSNDGRRLAIGHANGDVTVIEAGADIVLRELAVVAMAGDEALSTDAVPPRLLDNVGVELRWAPDHRRLLVWGARRAALQVWDVAEGRLLAVWPAARDLVAAEWTNRGAGVAALDALGRIHLWDASDGRRVFEPTQAMPALGANENAAIAASPAGETLAVFGPVEASLWALSPGWYGAPAGRNVALVIEHAYGDPALDPAGLGAREAAQALAERGFRTTLVREPSRSRMLQAIDQSLATLGPSDRIVIVLTGRTTTIVGEDWHYVTSMPPSGSFTGGTHSVAKSELATRLQSSAVGQVLVVVDGGSADMNLGVRPGSAGVTPRPAGDGQIRKVLASTNGSTEAYMMQVAGRNQSLFLRKFVDALQEATPGVTAEALTRDIARRMRAEPSNRQVASLQKGARPQSQQPELLEWPDAGGSGGTFALPPARTPGAAADAAAASAVSEAASAAAAAASK